LGEWAAGCGNFYLIASCLCGCVDIDDHVP